MRSISLRRRHGPRTLLDSLTRCAAKRRHSAAPMLEKVGQSRSAASPACHVAPAPFGGVGAHFMPFLLRALAASLWPGDKAPARRQDARGRDGDETVSEGFDHVVFERLGVCVLAQAVHPAHRSVQGMVHPPIWCFSCFSCHVEQGIEERPPPILFASPFPIPCFVKRYCP
jgi:hypothetical protein